MKIFSLSKSTTFFVASLIVIISIVSSAAENNLVPECKTMADESNGYESCEIKFGVLSSRSDENRKIIIVGADLLFCKSLDDCKQVLSTSPTLAANAPGCKTTKSNGYVSCENIIIDGNIFCQTINDCTIYLNQQNNNNNASADGVQEQIESSSSSSSSNIGYYYYYYYLSAVTIAIAGGSMTMC
jgi:hypothetical protein